MTGADRRQAGPALRGLGVSSSPVLSRRDISQQRTVALCTTSVPRVRLTGDSAIQVNFYHQQTPQLTSGHLELSWSVNVVVGCVAD